jgi:hypothetical protein
MNEWLLRFRQLHQYRRDEGVTEPYVIIGRGNIVVPGIHPVRITPPINDNERGAA